VIISNQDVHIWQATLAVSAEHLQSFTQILAEDEQARANRFKFSHHRDRFIAARGILRTLLSNYLNQSPEEFQFSYSDRGKPLLEGTLSFNVSHSEDLALYAFTCDRSIGIDVEFIRPVENLEGLTHRFFCPSEHTAIAQLPPKAQPRMFFRYWTCKEAYLKATGEGLAELSGLEFSIDQTVQLKAVPTHPEWRDRWIIKELDLSDQFIGTVATCELEKQLEFKQFNFDQDAAKSEYSRTEG
jgi:4'-phosphopantetheinyl transferase